MKRAMPMMTPAPCWFPMTLMALSLWNQMMMTSTKKRKKTIKIQMTKRQNQEGRFHTLAETSNMSESSTSVATERPRLDLKEHRDPVEERFQDACCRDLSYFAALSELPRWGLAV